jgi:hypothetical protein
VIERLKRIRPAFALELFIASNLAFLAVDIFIAHTANRFERFDEWAPIAFSVIGTLLLLPGVFRPASRESWSPVAIGVGAASVVIGLAGMVFHLESAFFADQTLKNLVYTAPFAAPLAYVGLGLLLILTRVEQHDRPTFGAWVLFLAMGGFVGNFALSLADHAQNGFFKPAEWLSVAAAAFGASFLAAAVLWPTRALLRMVLVVMALEVAIGTLGAVLHLLGDLGRPGARIQERLVYGAPVFAPLLFADLAMLAAIGVWIQWRHATTAEPAPAKLRA